MKQMIALHYANIVIRGYTQSGQTLSGSAWITQGIKKMMEKKMEITLYRKYKLPTYTIGKLYIDGQYLCDTVEDKDRGLYQGMSLEWLRELKVYGETAIPYGRYKVTLNVQSPKYANSKQYSKCKGYLPRLMDVPAFDGILVHIGNFAKDSCGCILLGENKVKGGVVNSTEWFWKFYDILKKANDEGKDIYFTVQP